MDEYAKTPEEIGASIQIYTALREQERRSIRRQSLRAGLCVIAFLVLQYAFSNVLVSTPALFALYRDDETARGIIELLYYLLCMLGPFLVAYLTMRPDDRSTLTLFGKPASLPAAAAAVGAGFLVCTASNYVTNILLSVLGGAGFSVGGGSYDTPLSGIQLVFNVLTIGVLPAFVEEFALRGIVMQPLRRHGDRFAVLMSAFVFALMHGNLSQFTFAFPVGVAIGYFVVATGSVWVGVAIHLLNNLYSVILNYLLDTRPTVAEFIYRLELSVVLVAGTVCLVLFLTVCRRNRMQKPAGLLTGGEKASAYIFTVPMILAVVLLVVETIRLISYEGG